MEEVRYPDGSAPQELYHSGQERGRGTTCAILAASLLTLGGIGLGLLNSMYPNGISEIIQRFTGN